MSEIRAIGDRTDNAQLMQDCYELGYLDGNLFDATYGTGRFWKGTTVHPMVTNDLHSRLAQHHDDFRDLRWATGYFDSVVFDPPYKLNGTSTGRGPSAADQDYGVGGEYSSVEAKMELIYEGAIECARVSSRYLLVKCQDQVVSGNVVWQTHLITSLLDQRTNRFALIDKLHVQGYRKQPEGRRQLHARRDYSTLLVFEKRPPHQFVIGFLGEDHPLPVVHDGELWPDAEEVKGEE